MGNTRDLFKKIRDTKGTLHTKMCTIQERNHTEITDTKGTFHAKMGSINDRNGMDLTEAEDIKKRQQEYTE